MDIKDRIKESRTTIGITQSKFAEKISIDTSLISGIESGVRDVNEHIIRQIVKEYNINEDWLRTGIGTMFNDDVGSVVSKAINMFISLDSELQNAVLKILTALNEANRTSIKLQP